MICSMLSYTFMWMLDFTGAHPKDNKRPLKSDPKKLESVKWRKTFTSSQNAVREKKQNQNKALKTIRETVMNPEDREGNETSELCNRFSPGTNKTNWK